PPKSEGAAGMADKAMDVYLNDHLAGAMLGSDLAEQIRDQNQNTPLGELMQSLAPQIEEDRQTLRRARDIALVTSPVARLSVARHGLRGIGSSSATPSVVGLREDGPNVRVARRGSDRGTRGTCRYAGR